MALFGGCQRGNPCQHLSVPDTDGGAETGRPGASSISHFISPSRLEHFHVASLSACVRARGSLLLASYYNHLVSVCREHQGMKTTPNNPVAANLAITLRCDAGNQRREVAGRDR